MTDYFAYIDNIKIIIFKYGIAFSKDKLSIQLDYLYLRLFCREHNNDKAN